MLQAFKLSWSSQRPSKLPTLNILEFRRQKNQSSAVTSVLALALCSILLSCLLYIYRCMSICLRSAALMHCRYRAGLSACTDSAVERSLFLARRKGAAFSDGLQALGSDTSSQAFFGNHVHGSQTIPAEPWPFYPVPCRPIWSGLKPWSSSRFGVES